MTTDATATQQTADTSQTTDTTQTTDTQATQTTDQNAQTTQTTDASAAKAEVKVWGETWREDFAGEDAKVLGRLKRYESPKAAIEALIAAQNKIADGSYKKGITDKSTPEEIAEYRKQNGIPEKPEGYFEKLPDGLVIGEEDKALFDEFGAAMHAANADPKTMHTAVKWYYDLQDKVEAAQHEANVAAKAETDDTMRAEWGPDYRQNINLVNKYIGSMPQEVQDMLFKSTTPDGKQILNSPQMMQWMAQQARELNYTGATLPSGETSAKGLDAEIQQIEGLMGNLQSAYWKGSGAEAMQARYRDLVDMKDRIAQRAA